MKTSHRSPVLDATIIRNVSVDAKYSARADMTYRAGVEAIAGIAWFFWVRTDESGSPGSLIGRPEFEAAIEDLEEAGVPIKENRDEAWESFVILRSAYEQQLIGLDKMILPPPSPWTLGTGDRVGKDARR